jgi:hypothetical protein
VHSWYSVPTMGWMAPILKEKLKVLKRDLKSWNKEVFGNLSFQIEILIERVKSFNVLVEERILSLEEVSERNQVIAKLRTLLKHRDSQIIQRSRANWEKDGDANTWFIQVCLKSRHRRNFILALRVGDRWVEDLGR